MVEDRIDGLRDLLAGARIWGAEVDLTYRVLGLTVEPPAEVHPDPTGPDARVSVLLHPVGTIAAMLVRHDAGPPPARTVLTFPVEQLPDIVATLDGPVPVGDPLGPALPDLGAIEDRLSLRGMAQVAEGHDIPLTLHLSSDDLTLDLWATFDDVELRDPTGEVLTPDW